MTTTADEAIEDRYPSRVTAAEPMLARPDPTVWGDVPGPLSPAELKSYRDKGFHTIDGLLTASQVQDCWTEFERLSAAYTNTDLVIRERRSGAVRSVFRVHRTSLLIEALARTPRILDRARQILGSEVYIHQSRINAMPGMSGTGFYWHSDFETWHSEDGLPTPRTVSLSIALTDNYAFNGGLMLMPGAHRKFVPCVGQTPMDNHQQSLQEQRIGVPDERSLTELGYEFGVEQFTGPAGSALFFDANSMHGSANNITPFPRANVFLVFNSVENAPVEPFGGTAPRPEHLAERDLIALTPLSDSPFS